MQRMIRTSKGYIWCGIGEKPVLIQVVRDREWIEQSEENIRRFMDATNGLGERRDDGERTTLMDNLET